MAALGFFDSAELTALRGMALATLPDPTPQQRAEAIDRFTVSIALRELPLAAGDVAGSQQVACHYAEEVLNA